VLQAASAGALVVAVTHDYRSPGLARVDLALPGFVSLDAQDHPWPHLRRDVPHRWYAHEHDPRMGVLNTDESTLLHNIALSFAGGRVLEIGAWVGWSTCHLALAGCDVDVIDPAHDDPVVRALVESALEDCEVSGRVRLHGGSSPASVATVAAAGPEPWRLVFVDGNHDHPGPVEDVLACLPHVADDAAFVLHDLAAPDVGRAFRLLGRHGFHLAIYQTAQILGIAWRGDVAPVPHVPDPAVDWQVPAHLAGIPVVGVDPVPAPPARRRLLDLLPAPAGASTRPPRVCVVTNELLGPFKNGGIGTAMTGLAMALAADGLDVTVLYTGAAWSPDLDLTPWREHYAALGITVDVVSFDEMASLAGPVREIGITVPALVDRYLRTNRFDVVHVNDCCGDGAFAVLAKRLGLAHAETVFVLAVHSPSRWVYEANRATLETLLPSAFDHLERLSVRNADVVWCPSSYLLGWAEANGFELPERSAVHPYVLPPGADTGGRAPGPAGPTTELVFFGRLEERKGLPMFCNAVDRLGAELAERGVRVTFLGKPHTVAGTDGLTYLRERSARWPFPIDVITDLGQPEAVAYVRQPGRVAVMPSPVDNSPCTVYEALLGGTPFVATRAGGIPELIEPGDRAEVLTMPTTDSLVHALRRVVRVGGTIVPPAHDQADLRAAWSTLHRRWSELLDPAPTPAAPRPVAVVVDWAEGADLMATLHSLVACTGWIGTVVVLNRTGSPAPDWCVDLDVVTRDVTTLGDRIVALAETEVLFVHAGVTVVPDLLPALVHALVTAPCDGVVPSAVAGARELVSLGGSAPVAFAHGATVTGGMLLRRTTVEQAVAVHEPDLAEPFLGFADACVVGADLWPFPAPALVRPRGLDLDLTPSVRSRLLTYAGLTSPEQAQLLATGRHRPARLFARRRELVLSLADAGLAPVVRAGTRALREGRRVRRVLATRRAR
jgi:glycosyltransferase involved in cell wall biosynthesis